MTRCRGCAATWTGTSAAHCRVCHTTWRDVAAFDRHRADGSCAQAATRVDWVPLVFEGAS